MADYLGTLNAELISGTADADTFDMLEGNDTIMGSAGADAIDGGADIDLVDYSDSGAAVSVDLGAGTGSGGDAEGDTYVGVENVTGSAFNDTLIGDAGDNVLTGGNGDDLFYGGSDTVNGIELGADAFIGGDGSDTVDYSTLGDSVWVRLGAGIGGYNDEDTYVSIENAVGSTYGDLLEGSDVANRLDGGDGDDLLQGLAGADSLVGGAGSDRALYWDSSEGVTVNLATGLGSGGDAEGDVLTSVEEIDGSVFDDHLTGDGGDNFLGGGLGNDSLYGAAGDDTIRGDNGDDYIDGGIGNDVLYGGVGTDTLDYSASASAVDANMATGFASGGMGDDTISGFEILIGSSHNDTLTGDSNNNVLIGGAGADSLTGGLGIDTADYSTSGGAVKVYLNTGTGQLNDAANDVLSGIENVVGSAFSDSLTGDTGDNALYGEDGNDTLLGGDGADTLDGGTGNDSMTGGNGNDVYFVDSADDKTIELSTGGDNDVVNASVDYMLTNAYIEKLNLIGDGDLNGTGNLSANTITGTIGNNYLDGASNNDILYGGDGNDTLQGGLGADTMYGGEGDDVYYVDNASDQTLENGAGGHETVYASVAWTLGSDFEDLTITTAGNVAGTGNAKDNVINGGTGNNLLTGQGGNDTLVGDLTNDSLLGGHDTLDGGSGDNLLIGGRGNDVYIITDGNDTLVELADEGTDTVRSAVSHTLGDNFENLVLTGTDSINGTGNALNNVMTGNDGDNSLAGGLGDDTLNGGIGADTLNGGAGVDSMVGGAGDDVYYVDDAGDKTIEASVAGYDIVYTSTSFTLTTGLEEIHALGTSAMDLTGNNGANVVEGNTAVNLLSGGGNADTLLGLGGDDTLDGGSGADSMEGGTGSDLYIVDNLLDLTIETVGAGRDTVQASVSWTLSDFTDVLELTGTSNLKGTGNGLANLITGTSGSNLLAGLGGADTLIGGDGNDTLNGGAGNDSMVGGTGNDIYFLTSVDDIVVELDGEGTDWIKIEDSYVLADTLENLTLLGTGDFDGTGNLNNNILVGNAGINALLGMDGNDKLTGLAGNDTLDGGTGADSMYGGVGADTYYVDNIGDVVVETGVQIDLVYASVDFTLGSGVENLVMQDGAVNGTGNGSNNRITGNSADNLLMGLGGNDTLIGGGGADTLNGGTGNDNMSGGAGNDLYIVNSVSDVVIEAVGAGIDSVESIVSYVLADNVENLTLGGVNRINATGNDLANVLIGNDNINIITGGLGNDTMTGGLGGDKFVFLASGNGVDTITDFNGLVSGVAEGDKMQFASSLVVGTFSYIGGAAFSASGNAEAKVNVATGRLLMDFNGDGVIDQAIVLTGLVSDTQLTASDFLFV